MNVSNILFTAIVPVYNVEQFLPCCIESILTQTFTNFEVILVDDGSTDFSSEICDYFAQKDSRVKVIHKENSGLVGARQAGVQAANGEYIACIDGDDWISSAYFEKFVEIINKYHCDVLCCGSVWWKNESDYKNKTCGVKCGFYDKEKIEKEIFPILIESKSGEYFSPTLWAKVFSIQKYQQQLVDSFVNIGEDGACVKPCVYYADSMFVFDDCLYFYRYVDSSMTKKRKAFDWSGPKIIGQHFENQIPMDKFDFQDQVYRNVVHNLFNVVFTQFYRKEKFFIICKEVNYWLDDSFYRNAINKCKFSSLSKGNFARIALKYRLYFLIWLYKKRHEKKGF